MSGRISPRPRHGSFRSDRPSPKKKRQIEGLQYGELNVPNNMPNEPELTEILKTILLEACISQEHHKFFESQDDETKWKIIQSYRKEWLKYKDPRIFYESIWVQVETLNLEDVREIITAISEGPLYWTRTFFNIGGHTLVLEHIFNISRIIKKYYRKNQTSNINLLYSLL